MSWGELFDRASEYEVTAEDVRAALARRREEAGEAADDATESGDQS